MIMLESSEAVAFDGSAAWASALTGLNTGQFTWSVFIKPYSLPGTYGVAVGFQDGSGANDKSLAINSSGQIACHAYDGSTVVITSSGTVPVGRWTHIGASADGSTLRLFIQGLQVTSAGCGNTYTSYSGSNVRLANARMPGSATQRFFHGALAYPSLWTKALPVGAMRLLALGADPLNFMPEAFWGSWAMDGVADRWWNRRPVSTNANWQNNALSGSLWNDTFMPPVAATSMSFTSAPDAQLGPVQIPSGGKIESP